ncbi:ras association domain-containing protein 1 isoform X3 [Cryptotermes secundus]|nr:ras association domain-containing protein 1 isoform X3 [Cryptotermes secundus]XP_023712449.1 ras association domain-containing protein 1 isoform X3 [Cryptotermes secundus]
MGLTESSPSSASGYTIFGRTRIYRSMRNSAAELTRSPSAPARILSSAPSPECSSANSNGVSPSLAVKSPLSQVANDETARVAVLADGSCAFFRVRRKSQPSKQESTAQKRLSHLPMPSPSKKDCHYTCHPQCRNLVKLDCRGENDTEDRGAAVPDAELEGVEHVVGLEEITDPSLEPLLQEVSSKEDAGTCLRVTREHLQLLITEYNAANPSGLDMTLEENGSTFRGFIRVHMNLCRPISVVAGTRPPSIYDILKDDETLEKTLTSFYLPRDTVKALHVTSETTTHEVVKALLKKFKVVDNPRKFALYERYYEQGETRKVKMRRIAENEKPLVLALTWNREKDCNKMFVLQENETGDILWEAFTLPELNNFLRILDREEEEYKNMVRRKYELVGRKIQDAMDRLQSVQQQHQASKVQGGS